MIWLAVMAVLVLAVRAHCQARVLRRELADARLKKAEMFMEAVAWNRGQVEENERLRAELKQMRTLHGHNWSEEDTADLEESNSPSSEGSLGVAPESPPVVDTR